MTRKHLSEARYNYYFIKNSSGIHNVGYALKLLEFSNNKLDEILGVIPSGIKHEEIEGVMWFKETEGLDPVKFDHNFHSEFFPDCVECHDKLFSMEKGATDATGFLTMSNMARGKFCGACHNGEIAESITERCEKCHVKISETEN
ncbi:MAG: hypothetical protein HQK84_05050 [Nitrospinae bacterium]|nr:hypothetical protein [Nitrospinota bacterium]